MRGAVARPSSRETTRLPTTSASAGTSSTRNRSAISGRSSTSTLLTESRRARVARCARGGSPSGAPGRTLGREEDEAWMIGSHREGNVRSGLCGYGEGVGSWYWIGVCVGIGVAIGVVLAGFGGRGRESAILVTSRRLGSAFVVGLVISDWQPGNWGDRAAGSRRRGLRPARSGPRRRRRAASRRHARQARSRSSSASALVLAGFAFIPVAGYLVAIVASRPRASAPPQAARALRRSPHARQGLDAPKKLVLIVVDGMTPEAFEHAVETGRAPALAYLARHGDYRRATSVFPSLTPVCLSSIATGAGPDVHHIPGSLGGTGRRSGSSSTARRSRRCGKPASRRRWSTRS